MHLPVYYEPVADNPYLADFYGDMTRYAFPMQIWLLNARFRQQQEIVWAARGAVQDRSIYEDAIFASMLRNAGVLSQRDLATYYALADSMASFMKRPSMIVWLDVTPETAYERVQARIAAGGRDFERGIDLEYLRALHAAYEAAMMELSRTVLILRLSYERFHDTDSMVLAICRAYEAACNVHELRVAGPDESANKAPVT